MSPEDAADGLSPEGRASAPAVPGIWVTVPPIDAPWEASGAGADRFRHGNGPRRSGITGVVPGERFTRLDLPGHSPRRTSKGLDHEKEEHCENRHKQILPTSEASQALEGEARISPPRAAREQVAALAYELWESRGRPEGTGLEDWFRAERRLQCHT